MPLGDGALITNSEADTHIARLVIAADRAGWDALSTTDKDIRLRQAQAVLDAGRWRGTVYDEDQLYSFPRCEDDGTLIGVVDETDPDSPLAPLSVREALALMAWSMTDHADAWTCAEQIIAGIQSQSGGGMSTSATDRNRPPALTRLMVCPAAWDRLRRLQMWGGRLV